MYIFHFFKRLFTSVNIPILIYLVLNIAIITVFFHYMSGGYYALWKTTLAAVVVYLISMTVALSPFGEWILRLLNRCRKVKDPNNIGKLEPLFREVHAGAVALDKNVPDNVRLYMNQDKSTNAYAMGRKAICLTGNMADQDDDMIKAAMAHEFGHLAHKDTDLILLITVGNFIVTIIVVIFWLIILFIQFCTLIAEAIVGTRGIFAILIGLLTNIFIVGFMWIWTKIGVLLVMKSSGESEYLADEFAFNIGYGKELYELISCFEETNRGKGLFSCLSSSHPPKEKRLERLRELGVRFM